MNVNSFYSKVNNLTKETIDTTNPKKTDELKTAMEHDLDSTLTWIAANTFLSKENLTTVKKDLENALTDIHNAPNESLKKVKAILEHSLGIKDTKIVPEKKDYLGKILFKGLNETNAEDWKTFIDKPTSHPEWIYFSNEVKQIFSHATDKDIKDVFANLMKGIVFELSDPQNLEELRKKKPEAYPAAIDSKEVNNLYAATRQIVRQKTLNPYYQQAFSKLKELDTDDTMFHGWGVNSDPSRREASLWTGGAAVSEYASKNYRVLEKSKMGSLFDHFAMHPNWKVQYPIWNLLSEGFVASDISRQAKAGNDPIILNYNFRADDPNSIGQLIEIPTVLAQLALKESGMKGKKVVIKMIPLINDNKGRIQPVTKPIAYEINVNDFREKLKQGLEPLSIALDLLSSLSEDIKNNPDSKHGEVIKEFCKENSYAIGDYLRRKKA
jgi:hypothetical protein